jgi:hypothetical protein
MFCQASIRKQKRKKKPISNTKIKNEVRSENRKAKSEKRKAESGKRNRKAKIEKQKAISGKRKIKLKSNVYTF